MSSRALRASEHAGCILVMQTLYDFPIGRVNPKVDGTSQAKVFSLNIRHVDFDDWNAQDCERVTQAIAVVCPCTSIDQDSSSSIRVCTVDALTHFAFVVGLKTLYLDPQLRGE